MVAAFCGFIGIASLGAQVETDRSYSGRRVQMIDAPPVAEGVRGAEQTVQAVENLISAEARPTRAPGAQPMAELPRFLSDPTKIDAVEKPGDFDPNRFFSVLKHLSMEEGFVLDYVYSGGFMGARPFLYARRATEQPLDRWDREHAPDALVHVVTDGTAEGFFKLTILRVMGEQFYLWWHALRNEVEVICGRDSAVNLPAQVRTYVDEHSSDIAPVVALGKDTARVELCIFTQFRGLLRLTYEWKRMFPHSVVVERQNVLVFYQSGIRY